jgi:hypothetical protein
VAVVRTRGSDFVIGDEFGDVDRIQSSSGPWLPFVEEPIVHSLREVCCTLEACLADCPGVIGNAVVGCNEQVCTPGTEVHPRFRCGHLRDGDDSLRFDESGEWIECVDSLTRSEVLDLGQPCRREEFRIAGESTLGKFECRLLIAWRHDARWPRSGTYAPAVRVFQVSTDAPLEVSGDGEAKPWAGPDSDCL